jgi:hypothetical protein
MFLTEFQSKALRNTEKATNKDFVKRAEVVHGLEKIEITMNTKTERDSDISIREIAGALETEINNNNYSTLKNQRFVSVSVRDLRLLVKVSHTLNGINVWVKAAFTQYNAEEWLDKYPSMIISA